MKFLHGIIAAIALVLAPLAANAALTAVDDNGQTISLQQPARRVISLAPHTTELLFAAGGGAQIVGTVEYSDFPAVAKKIPRVGDNRSFDLEKIIALKPDLLVVWQHGNSERQLQKLRSLGVPMFYSEPKTMEDVSTSIERLGVLLGRSPSAQQAATKLRQRVTALRQKYSGRPTVKVFYQVWDKPLMTLNGQHIISDAIRLCGGENPFARLSTLAPTIDLEAVLATNPEVIISSNTTPELPPDLLAWKRYTMLLAVKRNNLFTVSADDMSRNGPRIVDGAEALCRDLDVARARR